MPKRYLIIMDGVVICQTSISYPSWIIRDMKANGYKIKEIDEKQNCKLVKEE